MPCDEYKKLNLLHETAEFRVWRYANPRAEPPLRLLSPHRLSMRLMRARDEETDLRDLMELHIGQCEACMRLISSGSAIF